MTYKSVQIGRPKPVGVGMMQVDITYTYTKPKWGVIPIMHSEEDTLTYITRMEDSQVMIEERSLMTEKLGYLIDIGLREKILEALLADGHAAITKL